MNPISHFVSYYDRLAFPFHQSAMSLNFVSKFKFYQQALMHLAWKHAMNEEINAFISWKTWDLVTAPSGLDVVGCHWILTVE